MRTIKLLLAYDGTAYAGWQRQKQVVSIQQTVEEAVSTMTQQQTVVHGAGRTDAGVHALAMPCHFVTSASIPCTGFFKGLNSLLPADIRVLSVEHVAADFHARFHALRKTYQYHWSTRPVLLPTERLYCAHLPAKNGVLCMSEVEASLALLVGIHDFTCFEASGSRDLERKGGKGAVREIFNARLYSFEERSSFMIEVSGSGFLRHMVRNIVGTLFDVAQGKYGPEHFHKIFQGKDRNLAGATAPASGLFLKEVFY